jgi:hypothetical protein
MTARKVRFAAAIILLVAGGVNGGATPLGTAFTYQGQLKQDGVPVNGLTDFEFSLWDQGALGLQIGLTVTETVSVENGLFTANLDFGEFAFDSAERWVQVAVRHPAGAGDFVPLARRQRITATPYAHGLQLPLLGESPGTQTLFTIRNTGGAGDAGFFQNTNAANNSAALRADCASGTAVRGISATGRAGLFDSGGLVATVQATNSSTGPAVRAINESTGAALYADGDLVFNDDEDGIVFNFTVAPNVPMITMFPFGTGNANRMVIAHSPNFSDYGLEYEDSTDQFHFLGNGVNTVAVDLSRPDVSPTEGGFLVVGSPTAPNLALDNNEIMARNNGSTATLALNADGGNVTMFQSGEGRVGIGTASPGHALDVVGRARIRQSTPPSGGNTAGIWFYQETPNDDRAFIGMRNDDFVGLYGQQGAGWGLVMDVATGNVGIDALDPAAKLHVFSSSDAEPESGGVLVVGATNGGNVAIDGNEIMARNNGAVSSLSLNNDGGDIHMVVDAGTVTIGTNYVPPGVLLAVDGKILCEEMEVQLSGDWPDYVFADDYALMPLAELERAVDEHGHLPGIPSAADVAKEGINVGEMQTKLLKKIEELTLYMIDVNKQVESVRAENRQLRERISQLEGGR